MARPYHELAQAVERMEAELSAFAPMAQAMLRLEQRASAADERADGLARANRELERRLAGARVELDEAQARLSRRRGTQAEREAYRRGYGTGYSAAKRGAPEDVEHAMTHGNSALKLVADA